MKKLMPMENASQYQWLPGLNGDVQHTQRKGERQSAVSKRDNAYKAW
ncbi:hypothetical protein [Pectobacterium sp. A5351]|nr:hypothetical protein [Pectobacterium sp. A5351]WCG85159.1 hypothetical protein O1Q74_06475 [Pectobacterium sp. A5351]